MLYEIGVILVAAFVVPFFIAKRMLSRQSYGHPVSHKFPNGLTLKCIDGDIGTNLVYHEIFESVTYFKRGVHLQHIGEPRKGAKDRTNVKSPLIVDVGTNVGFFATYCATTFKDATIVCCEPLPRLCECIRSNCKAYIEEDRVKVNNVGIGKNEDSTFEFQVDYTFSAGASMATEAVGSVASKEVMGWIHALVHDAPHLGLCPHWVVAPIVPLLAIPYFRVLVAILLLPVFVAVIGFVSGAPKVKEAVKMKVSRLATVLSRSGVADDRPIDLLKVDVEGAEWDVLCGIDDKTWSRVQQIAVEVHDIDGRLDKICEMLKQHGFANIHIEPEDLQIHVMLKMATIFATRD